MSLRPRTQLEANPSQDRLGHVLNVGMQESIGAPMIHWMEKKMTPAKLGRLMKTDLIKKIPRKVFELFRDMPNMDDKKKKSSLPASYQPKSISVIVDVGIKIRASVELMEDLSITVVVTGTDYNEQTLSDTSTLSPLPRGVEYKSFIDLVSSSIEGSLIKMYDQVQDQRAAK